MQPCLNTTWWFDFHTLNNNLPSSTKLNQAGKMSLLNYTSIPPPLEERIARYKSSVLIPEIKKKQMMFVAGETGEPAGETTTLIENIVHEQVIAMVSTYRYRKMS